MNRGMNPNHGDHMAVVHHAHDGCHYNPIENSGALTTDQHFLTTRAAVIVGGRIKYRLCADCAKLPLWAKQGRKRTAIAAGSTP